MADLQQQIDEARKQGYSEQEITGYLQKQRPELAPKIKEAIDTGYDASDILRHLAPPAAAPSLLQDIGTSFQNFGRDVGSAVYGASATANRMVANLAQGAEGLLEKYGGLPQGTPLRDLGQWARGQQIAQQQEAQRLAGGRTDFAGQVTRGLTQGVLELPQYAVAAHVAGPVAGMAAIGAITEADQGWQAALEAAASGALTGGALHVMGPASQAVRLTGAAAMTYAQARLQGASHTDALAHATTMGLMAGHRAGGVPAREFVPGLDAAARYGGRVAEATGAGARAAAPDVAKGSGNALLAYGLSYLPVPEAVKAGMGFATAAQGARQIGRGVRKGFSAARASMAETAPAEAAPEAARPGERPPAAPPEPEVPPVTPEEAAAPTTQAVGTLEYNAPEPPPPAAPGTLAAADIAAQLEASMRTEALTDYVVRKKIPTAMVEQFGPEEWRMIANEAGVKPPTPENIQAIRGNLAEYEAAANPPAETGKLSPAEAKADFEQRRATRTKRQAAPASEADLESQLADSLAAVEAGKRPMAEAPPQGPAKPTAAQARVETLAQHLAGIEGLNLKYLDTIAQDPEALAQLDQLGRNLKVRGPQTPAEIQQIVDRVRQLRTGSSPGEPLNPNRPAPDSSPAPAELGVHGPIFRQFYRQPEDAIAELIKHQTGEAVGALFHPAVGDIDLVWGKPGRPWHPNDNGYGLAHIIAKHGKELDITKLQQLLDDMHPVESQPRADRMELRGDKYRSTVRLDWDKRTKKWLLTTFDHTEPPSAKRRSIVPGEP